MSGTSRATDQGFAARQVALAVLLACVLAGGATASALASGSSPGGSQGVSAVDAHTGRRLAYDPVVQRGERVLITVRGFATRARVQVGLVHHGLYRDVFADAKGVVSYAYTIPAFLHDGRYALIFSGVAAHYPHGPSAPHHASRTRDPQNVEVTVPFDPQWPFHLGGPTRTPPSSSASHGTGGGHGQHGGGTSFTGVDVLGLLAAALVVIGAGVALLRLGRRRGRRA